MLTQRRPGRWQAFILALLVTVIAVGNVVLANGLPTPTFYMEFNNAPEGRPYYVILLTADPEYVVDFDNVGVHGTIVGEERLRETSIPAFLEEYKDPDGFQVSPNPIIMCEGDTYNGYFVPFYNGNTYRFIIYWDDTDEYKITEVFSLSDYNTRYGVDLNEDSDELSVKDVSDRYWLSKTYPGTIFRLIFTVVGEFIIALFFGLFKKKELLTVLVTNLISNLIAQAMILFMVSIYIAAFLIIEALVIVVEYLVYRKFFDKERSNGRIWAYSIVANIVTALSSFVIFFFQMIMLGYER